MLIITKRYIHTAIKRNSLKIITYLNVWCCLTTPSKWSFLRLSFLFFFLYNSSPFPVFQIVTPLVEQIYIELMVFSPVAWPVNRIYVVRWITRHGTPTDGPHADYGSDSGRQQL